jgi:hypothetical protein
MKAAVTAVVGIALMALSYSVMAQPAPHIAYADVVASGYSGPGEVVKQGPIRRFITHTPVRAVEVGTKFGVTVRTVGQPDGADIKLHFVWRVPGPGVKDAKTGRNTRVVAEEEVSTKIGADVERTFEFRDKAQIVRGSWRAEVWNGRRRIAMRRFAVN